MHTPLISAAALQTLAPAPVLLDCSFDLADTEAGERGFALGHLPGAQYVHLERDLSAPPTDAQGVFHGRHPLRSRTAYAAWMGAQGITPGRAVVVYDQQGAMFAARAWWVLRWMGHAQVSVLDGGLAAWVAAAGPVQTGSANTASPQPQAPVAAPYPVQAPAQATRGLAELRHGLGTHRLIDARAPERYRGEVEPLDLVAGHIPGAINRFFKNNLQANGCFKPAAQLQAEWQALLGTHAPHNVVHHCGSGVTACHNLLALEVAGWPGGALYPGSWSEWSAQPECPVARGDSSASRS